MIVERERKEKKIEDKEKEREKKPLVLLMNHREKEYTSPGGTEFLFLCPFVACSGVVLCTNRERWSRERERETDSRGEREEDYHRRHVDHRERKA